MPEKELTTDPTGFLELSQELLERGGRLRFQAHGRSMHPFIKNGDIIVVEPKNGRSVNAGDIIFYHRPDGSPTIHRLVKIHSGKDRTVLITKGDALGSVDPPVNSEQVLGRVIIIQGNGRTIKLNGWPGGIFGCLIAWTARGRYPTQGRVVRYIDTFGRFFLGRRIK